MMARVTAALRITIARTASSIWLALNKRTNLRKSDAKFLRNTRNTRMKSQGVTLKTTHRS